jgi:hypothetical protein
VERSTAKTLPLDQFLARFYDVSSSDPMINSKWKAGDWAVYRKSKRSTTPGPRATSVKACSKGENYTYIVDKFWIVDSMLPGDRLLLRTARGKTHVIDANDPNLRKPSWLRRLLWRERFRSAEASVASNSPHFAS